MGITLSVRNRAYMRKEGTAGSQGAPYKVLGNQTTLLMIALEAGNVLVLLLL